MNETPWTEARTLGTEAARETFALAARHVLADVATEYHAVITVPDFARAIQERTRIRNRQAPSLWVGDILYRVALDCQRRREPLLGSLVVGTDGRMSDWYPDTVVTVRGDVITDVEQHAAEERLECYRRHGAELSEDGGVPALPPTPETPARAPRSRTTDAGTTTTRTPRAPRPPAEPKRRVAAPVSAGPAAAAAPAAKTCPSCFMVLPSTGRCDNCD